MTFEEAGAHFVQLQGQYRQGLLQPGQFEQMIAQLRVIDPQQRWWQIEPQSGQWVMWNGTQWLTAQQLQAPPVAMQPVIIPPQQQAALPGSSMVMHAPAAQGGGMSAWQGLASVAPGFAIEMIQRWPVYRNDTQMLVGFAVPSLLPAILMPLVRYVGRFAAILVVLGCLAWLSLPFIGHAGEMAGNAQAVQRNAGRGLVGLSLLYLIPRLWRAGK